MAPMLARPRAMAPMLARPGSNLAGQRVDDDGDAGAAWLFILLLMTPYYFGFGMALDLLWLWQTPKNLFPGAKIFFRITTFATLSVPVMA